MNVWFLIASVIIKACMRWRVEQCLLMRSVNKQCRFIANGNIESWILLAICLMANEGLSHCTNRKKDNGSSRSYKHRLLPSLVYKEYTRGLLVINQSLAPSQRGFWRIFINPCNQCLNWLGWGSGYISHSTVFPSSWHIHNKLRFCSWPQMLLHLRVSKMWKLL